MFRLLILLFFCPLKCLRCAYNNIEYRYKDYNTNQQWKFLTIRRRRPRRARTTLNKIWILTTSSVILSLCRGHTQDTRIIALLRKSKYRSLRSLSKKQRMQFQRRTKQKAVKANPKMISLCKMNKMKIFKIKDIDLPAKLKTETN